MAAIHKRTLGRVNEPPPRRNDPLKLNRQSDDADKIVFATANDKYLVYQYKDDTGFEVFERKKDGSAGKSFPELRSTYKEVKDFLVATEAAANKGKK